MCTPHIDPPMPLPERQSLQAPYCGPTAPLSDDELRRRRAMMATAYTGQAGLGTTAATTNILGS